MPDRGIREQVIAKARRVVVKVGTSSICDSAGRLDYKTMRSLARQLAALMKSGRSVTLVASGAIGAGVGELDLPGRPRAMRQLQAVAAVGQGQLMRTFHDLLARGGVKVAQVLLTHHNFSTQSEEQTIRTIMEAYLQRRTIPIVNENDMVNKEEVEARPLFSDNDILAALVAIRLRAELLLILTDVDGLYQANPKHNSHVSLITEVGEIDRKIEQMAAKETNPLGLGGMASKVKAAKMVAEHGIETIIANGRYRLSDILQNRAPRTLFRSAKRS